ncbi:MAG TPA: cache domain-containing protein [Candidatus Dormibacteraeota bacterium]|nr:cache domain-containing protein [Candidatus Dormibacteraeota bacterium]
MKLRTFLLAVVSLTLAPLLGVAGIAIWWAHQDERRAMEQALLYHARSLTVAVDREVETSLAALNALATSSDLDPPDLRRFYEQARLVRQAYRRWLTVALVDPSGQQMLNLLHPLGSPLPSVAGLEAFQRTLRTGEPQVSDLVMGPTAGRWVIAVTLPLLRDGKIRHVLVAVMTPESFASVLAAAHIADGTVGTIVDRKGNVVATTQGQVQQVGKPAPAGFAARAREHEEAVFTGPTLEGSTAYTAFSRASRSQFTVGVAVPSEQLEGPLRRSLWLLSAGAVGAFVLSLGLAQLAGRRFAGNLRRLTSAFRAFSRGETVPELPEFQLAELAGVKGALGEAMALLQTRTAELEESEQRHRTMFERNPAGMCQTLADGRIVACNEAFARILGFERPADVLAANVGQFYAQPKEREQLLDRVKAEGTAVNVELQFRRRDGRLIWVLANVIRGSGPPRADFETTLIDITEQKAADELRSIAKLANAAAHEINNPLTLVIGRLALLQDDPGLSPEARQRIAQVHAAAERIREIVIDMNHLTRVELFEHSGHGLPEMIDIRKSAGQPPS